jgi:hypothetical protein
VTGFFELNASPGYIAGLARGFVADAKELTEGIEAFRVAVSNPNCFGDDEAGRQMKAAYPSDSDIDDTCTLQSSLAEGGEAVGAGLVQMLNMMDEVVQQGVKNVESAKRAT